MIIAIASLKGGVGKAQSLDSKILTPTGWKRMGDIQKGDRVIGSNGLPTRVLGVFPQGKKKMYRVAFSDGATTECCAEHLWAFRTYWDRAKDISSVEDIRVAELRHLMSAGLHTHKKISGRHRERNGGKPSARRSKFSIPLVNAVHFSPVEVPIDPYLLGVILGDGCISKSAVSLDNPEEDIQSRVRKLVTAMNIEMKQAAGSDLHFSMVNKAGRGSGPNKLLDGLRVLGLGHSRSWEKFVPDAYKWNSASIRLRVLQGLLDTDGTVSNGCINFCTTSTRLVEDVIFLARSLGGVATQGKRERKTYLLRGEKKRASRYSYRVTVILPGDMQAVTSAKHLARLHSVKPRKFPPSRFFSSVKLIGNKEAQCIAVAAPDRLYVTDDFIVTHNTSLAIFLSQQLAGDTRTGRLLTVDADPNNNLTEFFLRNISPEVLTDRGLQNVLRRKKNLEECIFDVALTKQAVDAQWGIVPCTVDLHRVSDLNGNPAAFLWLGSQLKQYCDTAVIDTPPSLTFEFRAAIYAADTVIVPVTFSVWVVDALRILAAELEGVEEIRGKRPRLLAVPFAVSPSEYDSLLALDLPSLVKDLILVKRPVLRRAAMRSAVNNSKLLKYDSLSELDFRLLATGLRKMEAV